MVSVAPEAQNGRVPALGRGWPTGWDGFADLARAAALLSVFAGALWLGLAETGRFAAVFLALLVPRWFRISGPVDALVCATAFLATWSGAAGWYQSVEWLDDAAHFIANGAVAAAAYLVLARLQIVHEVVGTKGRRRSCGSVVLLTAAFGLTLGALWEFIEWIYKMYEPTTIYGYADTVGDLAGGGLGSLIAGFALWWAAGLRSPGAAGFRAKAKTRSS